MSKGYRVILCMGFSRKLDRGIPLHRGSDANFCKNREAYEETMETLAKTPA